MLKSNIICGAVALFCSNVSAMIVEDIDETSSYKGTIEPVSQERPALTSLFIGFPCAITSGRSIEPTEWRKLLVYIKQDLNSVKEYQEIPYLPSLRYLVHGLCAYAADSFITFCSSEHCDQEATDIVMSLLSLFPQALSTLPQNDKISQLMSEFYILCNQTLHPNDLELWVTPDLLSRVAFEMWITVRRESDALS